MVAVTANNSVLPTRDILSLTRYEEINGENYIDLTTTRELKRGDFVRVTSSIDGIEREYIVWEVNEPHEQDLIAGQYRCVWSLQAILSAVTSSTMPRDKTARQALEILLTDTTAFTIGTVEPTTIAGASFWRMTAWTGLAELVKTWGGEVRYRYENGVRYIDLLNQLGKKDAFSFIYGTPQVERITRRMEDGPNVCRIIPLGAATETENGGYGRRIDITSVNGGKPYLEDAEEAAKYAGTINPTPTAYVENSDIVDPTELKDWGLQVLQTITRPSPEYIVEATDVYVPLANYIPSLGDSGTVIDRELGASVSARVSSITVDELASSVKATCSTAGLGELARLLSQPVNLGGINTNGYTNIGDRASYPLFVYQTLPANDTPPLVPCFVLDASDNGLYYFD